MNNPSVLHELNEYLRERELAARREAKVIESMYRSLYNAFRYSNPEGSELRDFDYSISGNRLG